jgi:hypothetical protein
MENVKGPALRHHTFTVPVAAARQIKLMAANTVLDGSVITAIRTRRYSATRKSLLGKAIVNDANFNAATLVLKKGNEVYMDNMPMEHIEQGSLAASGACGFQVKYLDLDWNTSFVEVAETVTLDTGAVFEFTLTFYIP